MADIVLDTNVIVAILYAADSQHRRARELLDRRESVGDSIVLVDFLVFEALSVLCRRATERKTTPPDLEKAVAIMRGWFDAGEVRFLARESERLVSNVLELVTGTAGTLNANDALLVALMREGSIDGLASFDTGFDVLEGFRATRAGR